jgi:polysaccharide pyruvyl transferase WcaK-like protein
LQEDSKLRKIGLLCEVTIGNLGNAAFEAAAVQHLHEYFPTTEFYGCCIDSLEALKFYNVHLFPLNKDVYRTYSEPQFGAIRHSQFVRHKRELRTWLKRLPLLGHLLKPVLILSRTLVRISREILFWVRSYNFLREFRLLIVCGGGQLSDSWGGPWGHPYALFTWATLAWLSDTPFIVLSVGAERVSSPLSRWFLKHALQSAVYRSYRDHESKRVAQAWGVGGEHHVYPDLAFSLKVPGVARITPGKMVGVSPMAYCDPRTWPIKDAGLYRRYLETLALFLCHLIRRGYTITLFASQVRMDPPVLHDLKELVTREDSRMGDRLFEPNPGTVEEFLALMPKLDFVVASRMHGILLSQLMYTPGLAISYDDKVESLMDGLGLSEFCLDIRSIQLPDLIERFAALEAKRESVADMLRQRIDEYRNALQAQYDMVFKEFVDVKPAWPWRSRSIRDRKSERRFHRAGSSGELHCHGTALKSARNLTYSI